MIVSVRTFVGGNYRAGDANKAPSGCRVDLSAAQKGGNYTGELPIKSMLSHVPEPDSPIATNDDAIGPQTR